MNARSKSERVITAGRQLVAELERESPLYVAILEGDVDRDAYLEFLVQHHKYIRLTYGLMCRYADAMAASSNPTYRSVIRSGAANHAAEERGHDDGILKDIAALRGTSLAEAREYVDAAPTAPSTHLYEALVETTLARFPAAISGLAAVLECVGAAFGKRARDALLARRPFEEVERAVQFVSDHAEDGDHVDGGRIRMDLVEGGRDESALQALAGMTAVFYRELWRWMDGRIAARAVELAATS